MPRCWEGKLPMPERIFNCIICPKCCTIIRDGTGFNGAGCKRGVAFVEQELVSPRRTLTTTIRCHEGKTKIMIPVRSEETVPLEDITGLVARIKHITLAERPSVGTAITFEGIELRITG